MLAAAEITAYAEEMRRRAQGLEGRAEQWEHLRRRLTPRPEATPHYVAELCRAYEEATETPIGCD
jgi:hypothetical protein